MSQGRNLVFFGPPGSGKGTQAKRLSEKLNIPHVSVGDILREEVRQGTEIGKKAAELMNAGRLVPDEMTIELTKQRIAKEDCKSGFILDGFPRSVAQADAYDGMDRVIYFRVNEDRIVERLSGRRSCKSCGEVFHLKHKPPKTEGKCDLCGGELYQRKDDNEETVRTRFEVYARQTSPLLDRYKGAGKLLEIDADQPIEMVFASLLKAVNDTN